MLVLSDDVHPLLTRTFASPGYEAGSPVFQATLEGEDAESAVHRAVASSRGEVLALSPSSLVCTLSRVGLHAWVAAQLQGCRTHEAGDPLFVVHSEDLLDAHAALLARAMGAKIGRVHVASDGDSAAVRYITGLDDAYAPSEQEGSSQSTSYSSNWQRIAHLIRQIAGERFYWAELVDIGASASGAEHVETVFARLQVRARNACKPSVKNGALFDLVTSGCRSITLSPLRRA